MQKPLALASIDTIAFRLFESMTSNS